MSDFEKLMAQELYDQLMEDNQLMEMLFTTAVGLSEEISSMRLVDIRSEADKADEDRTIKGSDIAPEPEDMEKLQAYLVDTVEPKLEEVKEYLVGKKVPVMGKTTEIGEMVADKLTLTYFQEVLEAAMDGMESGREGIPDVPSAKEVLAQKASEDFDISARRMRHMVKDVLDILLEEIAESRGGGPTV